MTIHKRIEITVETERLVVVSKRQMTVISWCASCRERRAMMRLEEAAIQHRVPARRLYAWLEAGKIHFRETEEGLLLVCLDSIAALMTADP